MKKRLFATLTLIFGCVMLCMAIAADITGKWSGTVTTPNGSIPLIYNFKTDAGKLTGTVESSQGATEIYNGKATESDLSFSVDYNGMVVKHTGKVYADSIGMDIDANGQKIHFKLVRATDKP